MQEQRGLGKTYLELNFRDVIGPWIDTPIHEAETPTYECIEGVRDCEQSITPIQFIKLEGRIYPQQFHGFSGEGAQLLKRICLPFLFKQVGDGNHRPQQQEYKQRRDTRRLPGCGKSSRITGIAQKKGPRRDTQSGD